ncbi:hypothetical protein Ahy_A03g013788 [Arachis hypogaea]|uniref:SWIM-type domain-containing protein n=1 Tax=Arachis hypogaea TaxID=3818 RepID=A0A445DW81_ARAHY|nr:hypothetical protein Ahy_A03g013788 [Arachis hypogaea]
MVTNLSECINAVLKGTRYLPISAIMRITYKRLHKVERRSHSSLLDADSYRDYWPPLRRTQKGYQRCVSPIVTGGHRCLLSKSLSLLRNGGGSFRVRLLDGTCDYVLFQSLHYPCHHALAGCSIASIEWALYVHPVYRQEVIFKVYKMEFRLSQMSRCGEQ